MGKWAHRDVHLATKCGIINGRRGLRTMMNPISADVLKSRSVD